MNGQISYEDSAMQGEKAFKFIYELVELLLQKNGSDLFITAGSEPAIKINNEIHRVGNKKLTPEQTSTLVRSVMNDRQTKLFDNHHEANFALNFPEVARFRASAFQQRGSVGMVLRYIKSDIPSFEQLNLPPLLRDLSLEPRGLILFVGATGCGKSTSMAAMIDHRNEHTQEHIVTLEDPIEYFHRHKKCIVNQREIGTDADSYAIALKNTLRQAPNVILIGEIRDQETMEYALTFAETGHLVMSTLHANSADQAFDRIINFFPHEKREQALMDLSFNLKALISQRLIQRKDQNSMIPAVEILLNTPLVADLIFQNRIKEIKETMMRSSEQGLITFNQSLFQLYEDGKISYESALRNADSVNDLRLMIKLQSRHALPPALQGAPEIEIKSETKEQFFDDRRV